MSDFLVNPAGPQPFIPPVPGLTKTADPGDSFSAILGDALQNVNDLQKEAGQQAQNVMTGEITDIHTAMIAVQKADVAFQMMMQVRNKLVSAYQEIMKMQV